VLLAACSRATVPRSDSSNLRVDGYVTRSQDTWTLGPSLAAPNGDRVLVIGFADRTALLRTDVGQLQTVSPPNRFVTAFGWLPDSTSFLAAERPPAANEGRTGDSLVIVSLDGTTLQLRLSLPLEFSFGSEILVSRDGRVAIGLAHPLKESDDRADVYGIHLATGEIWRITDTPTFDETALAWFNARTLAVGFSVRPTPAAPVNGGIGFVDIGQTAGALRDVRMLRLFPDRVFRTPDGWRVAGARLGGAYGEFSIWPWDLKAGIGPAVFSGAYRWPDVMGNAIVATPVVSPGQPSRLVRLLE